MFRLVTLVVLSIIAIILLTSPTHSMTIEWQNILGGNGSSTVSTLQKTTDGYILVGSSTSFSSNGNNSIYVAKITEAGRLLWDQIYAGNIYSVGNFITPVTNGYMIAGSEGTETAPGGVAVVIKIDNNGHELWRQNIPINNSTYSEVSYILPQTDGCVVTGYAYLGIDPQYKFTMFLAKILDDGTISWIEEFPDIFQFGPVSIQNADDGFIVAGSRYQPYEQVYSGFMAKINNSGGKDWSYQYPPGDYQSYFFGFQKIADNSYMAVGGYVTPNNTTGTYTVTINDTGDVQQFNVFPPNNAMATSLTMDQDTVDLTGWVLFNNGDTSITLRKMWLNGTTIFADGIFTNSSAVGSDIKPDGRGNYVIAGNIKPSGSGAANTSTSIFVADINMNATAPTSTPTASASNPSPAGDNFGSFAILIASVISVAVAIKPRK